MVEICRVDIITKVPIVASQMPMLREGHLDAVLHVFAFLCQKYNSRMAFDLTYPTINTSDFKECTWKNFYGKLKESIPPSQGSDQDVPFGIIIWYV